MKAIKATIYSAHIFVMIMPLAIKIGEHLIPGEQTIRKLISYGLISQFVKDVVIDLAIASIIPTQVEEDEAIAHVKKQLGLESDAALEQWLVKINCPKSEFIQDVTRSYRIARFKSQKWGNDVPNLFIKRKHELDQAVYSLICVQDFSIAQELYFRIQAGEQTFAELASQYSLGAEAKTGGLVGPVELGKLHPAIGALLAKSKVGFLSPPQMIDQWVLIIRLEKFLPAQLDENTKARLIEDCWQTWLKEQMNIQVSFERVA